MKTRSGDPRIVKATRKDIPLIRQFILELAEYERAQPGEAPVTEKDLAQTLFGKKPAAEVLIAYLGSEPAGFALFFHNYSTWLGKRGIYLEDLFVRPAARKHGVGFALLRALARIACASPCELIFGGARRQGMLGNVSAFGVYVALCEPLPPIGSRVVLTFCLNVRGPNSTRRRR